MTAKLNFKNLFMIVIAIMLSVSFSSCFKGLEEEEWIEQPAIETGLCGVSWVWERSDSESETDSDIDVNTEKTIIREVYVFDLSGNGYHDYTYANNETKRDLFRWKSYIYNTTRMLTLVIDGTEYGTYYAIENMTTLRILVADENSDSGTATKEFLAE